MGAVWQNWSGTVRCRPRAVLAPATLEQLAEAVRSARDCGQRIRVAGRGHSHSALVETDELLLSLERFRGLSSIDPQRGEATVRGGTRLRELGTALAKRGFALETLGDIDAQSVAGAISTATHGTGVALGNLSTLVQGLTLVLEDGRLFQLDAQRTPALFRASLCSLGAFGVIAEVRLRIVPAYRLRFASSLTDWAAIERELGDKLRRHRHYELYWFPYYDTWAEKTLDVTDAPRTVGLWGKLLRDAGENFGEWALGAVTEQIRKHRRTFSRLMVAEEATAESHIALPTRRWIGHYEMELAIPLERCLDALADLQRWFAERPLVVPFPLEVRFVAPDDIPLSPSYGRPTCYVSFHMGKGRPFEDYFRAAQQVLSRYGARPHWGKVNYLSRPQLEPLYPAWDEFQRARCELDPEGRFMNPHLATLIDGAKVHRRAA